MKNGVDLFHQKCHFQRVMKSPDTMKDLENHAAEALRALLQQVPTIKLGRIKIEPDGPDHGIDILAQIQVAGCPHTLVCEVKASGQPRHVRTAILQLRNYLAHLKDEATPILIAPYLSPEAQALCREQQVAFLDLEGNARLVFNGVFIERLVASKPKPEQRELRSLFRPKSAQVLRALLRDPNRAWRVNELAQAAGVSLGHVSNVRTALLNREWARLSGDGISLSKPDALIDAWSKAYEPPKGKRLAFYTTLHGSAFEETARRVFPSEQQNGHAVFASFSAAHWLAPYARTSTHYFYADSHGLKAVQEALKLSSAAKGENVVVIVLLDPGLFLDTVEPARGVFCTSPVQTYLDLTVAGERGREAADHLRAARLTWPK